MRTLEWLRFLALLFVASFGLFACSPPTQAPEGYAIVREHLVSSGKGMVPQVSSNLDYTIVEIDGASFAREKVPLFADMQPGALISAGTHRIKAMVEPHVRPPNSKPKEVTFTATVESRKIYYLVDDKERQPVLVVFTFPRD